MRLTNGSGTVYKLSGKRRRPFIVRKTMGWETDLSTGKVKQKIVTIGYAKTREEGMKILLEYNDSPYNIEMSKITFKEIFDLIMKDKKMLSHSSVNAYNASYKPFISIANKPFKDLKLKDLQTIIDNSSKNYPTLRKIKVLLGQMYSYAIKNEIVMKDYSRFVNIDKFKTRNPNACKDRVFSDEEINKLWGESDDVYVSIILMLIYTGVRVSELLNLKREDVHLEDHYFFVRESKTIDGIRRVPIANRVFPFFEYWYSRGHQYLLQTKKGRHISYDVFRDQYWDPIMARFRFSHTPHDTRHTMISLMARKNVNTTIQKIVVGHKGAMSLIEKTYTHLRMQELLDAVNLI